MKRLALLMIAVMSLSIATGCSKPAGAEEPLIKKPTIITVSAAKSLTECLPEVADLYVTGHPEIQITFNFGSSGSMRQQIEQGAEVDMFMPAGKRDVDILKEKGLLRDDTIRNVLGNQLALIVPSDSTVKIEGFKELTQNAIQKLAVGEPGSVPAGKYAEETFANLGILDAVKSKTVYAKDVREVLAWVSTGNADAGVVYATDTKASDQIKVIAIADEASHSPIVYPGAILKGSKHVEEAEAFLSFISSDKAKTIFEAHGYTFLAH